MKIENVADLRVLVHTARGGTLTAAAAALGITPAAASATLKRLEAQLGTRLFERSTRAMRLTPQGQTLLDYAVRAFDLLAEGESMVLADRGALVGSVRLAAPSDLTRVALLPWLDEFLDRHPGLQLSLSVGDRPLDVTRDEVDVALRYGPLADSRLVARRLADSRPTLCAAPAYLQRHGAPATPHDLLQHNCLTFHQRGRRHRLWRFARLGHWTEVRVDGDRVADDASLAREWALAGRGITLKSALDLERDIAAGHLVRLLPEWETEPYPLHALLPSGRFVPARVRALVDFLALKFDAPARAATSPKIAG
ncbi:LysR substrate-binding domain-containing protein [Variovorax sp. J22P168]|uniref:LysR family transcriptional regulator n=1 Tax=Variovorax jilinensis TaxID=3053513 RepID=UPI00257720AF|nr:LysR family transcriptional regulator [Variovorax sp. J22P168]MDM0012230.1 LysR substrate-binding domain-containing protein [Variovorax sp. J22P168]